MPSDQSLDYLDGWCCGWNRCRVSADGDRKNIKLKKSEKEGWNARIHLEKEIKRRIKNKKALNKILNKEK